jgi:hypothetical protein
VHSLFKFCLNSHKYIQTTLINILEIIPINIIIKEKKFIRNMGQELGKLDKVKT